MNWQIIETIEEKQQNKPNYVKFTFLLIKSDLEVWILPQMWWHYIKISTFKILFTLVYEKTVIF